MAPAAATPPSQPAAGLLESLRRVVATLVAILQTRLELLATEIDEQVHRAAEILLWGFVALIAGAIGLLMLGVVIVVVFWDSHRNLAALGVTAFFLGTAAACALVLRSKLRARPRLLESSLAELERDREHLGGTRRR